LANDIQLIFGKHPLLEALDAGQSVEKIFIQQGSRGPQIDQILQLARQRTIPLQSMPLAGMNRLTRKNHQGVIAYLALVDYYLVEDVLPTIYDKGEDPLILILDGVSDVRNLGAIARTAYGSGVHALVFPAKHSAQINADAVKASAGALYKLQLCRSYSLADSLINLQLSGLTIYALDARAEASPNQVDFSGPAAIVMGGEGSGLSVQVLKTADHLLHLPIVHDFDSYNVSVATGMVLYEVMRQRMASRT